MAEAQFTKGMEVEVCSDDEGLRGVWFVATVARTPSKNGTVLVEYRDLMVSEKVAKPLRENVNVFNVRPIPPRELNRSFDLSDEVDAYHNDGWWEGVVLSVLENSRYSVYFRPGKEELEFQESDLRIHREWVNGSWVPPMAEGVEEVKSKKVAEKPELKQPEKQKEKKQKTSTVELVSDQTKQSPETEVVFNEGMIVEVCSDEEGFVGAWFSAKIIEVLGKNKFQVEYDTLRTDDDSENLKEEVDLVQIRPPPPDLPQTESFARLAEVDAFYNDAWWVGVISQVRSDSRYYVYFRESNEELEFSQSQLRFHQDWIGGKWTRCSEALKL